MNPVQAVSSCLYKFGTFSGRASRAEFWWFSLFQLVFWIAATLLIEQIDVEWIDDLVALAALALYLPGLAVGSRRLHDIGRSGWWQLLMLTGIGYLWLIYWWVQFSVEPNKHESDVIAASPSMSQ